MKKGLLIILVMLMMVVCSTAWADGPIWSAASSDYSLGYIDASIMNLSEPVAENFIIFQYMLYSNYLYSKDSPLKIVFPIEYSDTLKPVEAIGYHIEDWEQTASIPSLIFKKEFDNTLDLSDTPLYGGNIYLFLFVFEYDVTEPQYVYMDTWPLFKDTGKPLRGESDYEDNLLVSINARFVYPASHSSVSSLFLDTATTPKAGIPYQLRVTTDPTGMEGAVQWSVVDAGTTGAMVTHDVLFTVGTGTVTLRATIPGGKKDGSDYTQDFVLTVAPIANPIGANGVSGISANDLFSIGDTVSFTAFAAEQNSAPSYGDYWYIPSRFAVHSEYELIGDIVNGKGSFGTEQLEIGKHTLTVQFTTMRYDGKQWVDAGNPYFLTIPFEVTASDAVQPLTYTITFDTNGGSCALSHMQTNTDGTLPFLPEAAKKGMVFDGWYTALDGGERVTASTVFTANAILYAHWVEIPKTGDDTPLSLWALLLVLALDGIVCLAHPPRVRR